MKITDLDHKNVCIIGYGREGQAMLAALARYAPHAKVTIADRHTDLQVPGANLQLGEDHLKGLDRFDVVIRSGGVGNLPEVMALGSKLTNMTHIFFDSIAGSGVRTIGVTGTKGKSTTTTLIFSALKAHHPETYLMGNIGIPMISFLDKAKAGAIFVIELSSYMLEGMKRSPDIAVVTSFFPEHLDRHGSVANYLAAKKNIAAHQTKEGVVFYNPAFKECEEIANLSPGKKFTFTPDDFPLPVHDTNFKGEHNRGNLAAALKVATYLGVPERTALQALKTTQPLAHRLQDVGLHAGIRWFNDSIATTPEATLAALDALEDIDTIIVGGIDRGYDFRQLAKRLATSSISNIIVFPDTGPKIRDLIEADPKKTAKQFFETSDMNAAVRFAAANTAGGSICLLSNASPSFNLFKDFEARGEAFMGAVKALD